MKKVLIIFGTRPEAIKLCPLIIELKKRPSIQTVVCTTGQHNEMLEQVLNIFGIEPDHHLLIMTVGQTLYDITTKTLDMMRDIFQEEKPDLIIIQGDTTTGYAAALSGFYSSIPVAHVEAGLRTNNIQFPFPEEFNRRSISLISSYDFAPTGNAGNLLIAEGKSPDKVLVTGNTVIDAMQNTIREDFKHPELEWIGDSKFILMTAHRRESVGEKQRDIFRAVKRVLDEHPEVKVLFPIHKNPLVRSEAYEVFNGCENIHIIEPLDFEEFHNFESRCYICVTDSGGAQEECAYLGKPTLVVRDCTERQEGVEEDVLKVVGTSEQSVYDWLTRLLTDNDLYSKMAKPTDVFGDGTACKQIADRIEEIL